MGMCTSTSQAYINVPFSVTARTAPTGFTITSGTLTAATSNGGAGGGTAAFNTAQATQGQISISGASGLVAGNATYIRTTSDGTLYWTGCEL